MDKFKEPEPVDKYRRGRYPRDGTYTNFSDHPLGYSPSVGRYYRVVKSNGETLEGWLDHSARMYGGAVLGFLYNNEGKLVGSAAVTIHAKWFEVKKDV